MFKESFKIDVAVDATSSGPEEVERFQANTERDSIFRGGYIKQDNQKGSEHRMLLFKLALGNILPIYKTNTKDLGFPERCDTIYMSEKQEEVSIFSHEYKVRSTKQYMMEYDVRFKYITQAKFHSTREDCEYCKVNLAEMYCKNDREFFCRTCYEEVHRSKQKGEHIY